MLGFETISMDARFSNLSRKPVFANNMAGLTIEERDQFSSLMTTVYEGDTIDTVPRCNCGETKGRYYLGEECDKCGTVVEDVFSRDIEPDMWLAPLPGVDIFITPIMWQMLSGLMKEAKNVDSLRWLTDPYYRLPAELPARLKYVEDQGHKRGLVYFYRHFDDVMRDFIDGKSNSSNRRTSKPLTVLQNLIKYNRDRIFTKVLMIPNKTLFPIEKVGKNSYGDTNMVTIMNAVLMMQEAESRLESLSLKKRESRTVAVISLFSQFHMQYMKKIIGSKNGLFRHHILGGRWHFTGRTVVTSISEPHDFREVWYPWVVAINQFQMQIVNKLISRGYGLQDINKLLKENALRYHPLLDEIFKELIEESPYIGLPIILQRNPTIRRPSAILVYVTKVKPDVSDCTISISVGNLTGMNCDFDGDQLNMVSLQDRFLHDNFVVLSPDHNVMDLSKPWKLSFSVKMQAPLISTTANWIAHGRRIAYGK